MVNQSCLTRTKTRPFRKKMFSDHKYPMVLALIWGEVGVTFSKGDKVRSKKHGFVGVIDEIGPLHAGLQYYRVF
jgi:hypothetical protein